MAKATPVRFGLTPRYMGEFHCDSFNIFDADERTQYEMLRTRANNSASGVSIEQIREYTRKTIISEGEGDHVVVTTTEDIILVVQYWEKPPEKEGDSHDDVSDAREELRGGGRKSSLAR